MKNSINLKMQFDINGATIFPTPKQYQIIQEFAVNLLFGQREPLKELIVERLPVTPFSRKGKSKVAWTPDQINMAKNLKLEGKSWKRVAVLLNQTFGTHRTANTTYNQVWLHNRALKRENILEPKEALPEQPLRQNEWGGIDGLQSPQL